MCAIQRMYFVLIRLSMIEQSAIRDLREKLFSYKTQLEEAFQELDTQNTGSFLHINVYEESFGEI